MVIKVVHMSCLKIAGGWLALERLIWLIFIIIVNNFFNIIRFISLKFL
jgi:hypothetical protein